MSPAQLRAARALVDLSQQELATRCSRSASLIRNFESGRTLPHKNTIGAIQKVLEDAGVSFDLTVGKGPGVRLRK